MGADGRDHDGGDAGVDHAGPGGHSVGRAPCRGGDNQAITLAIEHHEDHEIKWKILPRASGYNPINWTLPFVLETMLFFTVQT